MISLLALMPPVPMGGRVLIATVGFGLAVALTRSRLARPLEMPRLIVCFGVALCIAAYGEKDGRGILDFVAGACCGTMAWALAVRELQKPRRPEWALIAACFVLGPLLGLVGFCIFDLFGEFEAIDRRYQLFRFVIIGLVAGLLGALVTSVIVAFSPAHAEQSDAADSR
jgi:hypothetical protein